MPLVIAEPGSPRCLQLWQACDVRISSTLVIAEAHAALAQAKRLGRLTPPQHQAADKLLRHRTEELDLVTPSRHIVEKAAELALAQALRGYDAIHLATALTLDIQDLVAITADQKLLAAFMALGVRTANPTHPNLFS